jgi:hypothetical protein
VSYHISQEGKERKILCAFGLLSVLFTQVTFLSKKRAINPPFKTLSLNNKKTVKYPIAHVKPQSSIIKR